MIDLPKFNPPKLTATETLRRLRLQLQGLQSWPDHDDTRQMHVWVLAKIYSCEQQIKRERLVKS